MKIVLNTIIWVAIVTLFYSCQSTPAPDFNHSNIYKYDIELEVNGQKGIGVLVIDQADQYKIRMETKSDIDLLTIRDCHMSYEAEKGWRGNGAFNGKNVAKFEFKPNSPIQNEYCVVDIGAWNKNGRHGFGLIDIRQDRFKLSVIHNCNGQNYVSNGVSFCQAYKDTYQEIKVPETSIIRATTPECELDLASFNTIRYEIKKGICVYMIRAIESGKKHRVTTIGYEKIIIKE